MSYTHSPYGNNGKIHHHFDILHLLFRIRDGGFFHHILTTLILMLALTLAPGFYNTQLPEASHGMRNATQENLSFTKRKIERCSVH